MLPPPSGWWHGAHVDDEDLLALAERRRVVRERREHRVVDRAARAGALGLGRALGRDVALRRPAAGDAIASSRRPNQ